LGRRKKKANFSAERENDYMNQRHAYQKELLIRGEEKAPGRKAEGRGGKRREYPHEQENRKNVLTSKGES